METDIGTPFEYEPGIETENNNNNNNKVDKDEDTSTPIQEYFHPSEMMYMNQPPPPPLHTQNEFFSNIDKSTWIVAFAVFLLGFFMGKTMTPIILKSN